jgi:hypothetical protein
MSQGHETGWREVLANFVLSDTSPGHKNTRQYIKTVVKLMKDYGVPFTQRLTRKRELLKLTQQMRLRIPELTDSTSNLFSLRNELVKTGVDPEHAKGFDIIRLRKHEQEKDHSWMKLMKQQTR